MQECSLIAYQQLYNTGKIRKQKPSAGMHNAFPSKEVLE